MIFLENRRRLVTTSHWHKREEGRPKMNAQIAIDEHSRPWHTEHRWAIHMNGTQYECALIFARTAEVQVQVFLSGKAISVDRCTSREAAVAKADALKVQYMREGGLLTG